MSKTRTLQHGNRKYPWEIWEQGGPHEAKRGVHFQGITAEGFQRQLHVRAGTIGKRVESTVIGNVVQFQFHEKKADRGRGAVGSSKARR